jgi:ankyrin repeat protein
LWISFLIILLTSGCAVSLNEAIQKGDFKSVKSIIEKDSNSINIQNDEGETPLHRAILMGNLEIAKYLVSNGANINAITIDGNSPLHYAVYKSLALSWPYYSFAIVEFLVSNGADINAQNKHNKRTPLHLAIFTGNIEVIKYLIEQGAKINARDRVDLTPLHHAVYGGDIKIVKYLVEHGADVSSQDSNKDTPLHISVQSDTNIEVTKYLISKGSALNATNIPTETPLHKAIMFGNYETLKYLISKGSDINATTQLGLTSLHLAVKKSRIDIVIYLIEKGADLNVKDINGKTALDVAKNKGDTEIEEYLISMTKAPHQQYLTKKSKEIIEDRPKLKKKTKSEIGQKNKSLISSGIDFGKYFALVIGNNNYEHLPSLRTACNDAKAVAKILDNNYGFKVDLITDATRTDILLALAKFRKKLKKNDNLLIYYAGHGWLDEEADEGYCLPVDAYPDNDINWVSNSSITTKLKAIQAKHVLVVADSCYSGKLARGVHISHRNPNYFYRMSLKKNRSVLSSGGLEPVIDSGGTGNHSIFASAFINVLIENKGIIDGTLLFSKIRRPVMLNADQIPEYSDIRKAGHQGGDFLFLRKR